METDDKPEGDQSPPRPDKPVVTAWFYIDANGQQAGPVDLNEMQQNWVAGILHEASSVWESSMESWAPVSGLPLLHKLREASRAAGLSQQQFYTHGSDPNSEKQGPFALGDLADQWGDGVTEETYVWSQAIGEWMPITALHELREELVRLSSVEGEAEEVDYEALYLQAAEGKMTSSELPGAQPEAAAPEGAGAEGAPAEDAQKKRKYMKAKELKKTSWFENKDHTYVYVTGLPEDTTHDEYVAFMSKCGMIKEDDNGELKLKLYLDSNSVPKGDGLCCYLKDASVELALNILDGSEFRTGSEQVVSVTKAKFQQKGDAYVEWKPKKKKKKSVKKKNGQESQLSWQDWRDDVGAQIVIIKNVFDSATHANDEQFISDLKDDMEMECAKKGLVEKTTVFPHHPEGVVAVKYKDVGSAEACIKAMDGRWFSQRKLSADFYDGKSDYSVGAPKRESVDDQLKRVDDFGDWLEKN